jgi:hypothetical protein
VNGALVATEYSSVTAQTGAAALENTYRTVLGAPEGADGFEIYAIAYDKLGQSGRSETVRVGKIEDTVEPVLEVLAPAQGAILTASQALPLKVTVKDIGVDSARHVFMKLTREAQVAGGYQTLAEAELELLPIAAQSDAANHTYVYATTFADANVLARGSGLNERVRTQTRVVTPKHSVTKQTTHEVGLQVSERRYFAPATPYDIGKSVYYTALDQFTSPQRSGALVGAWATHNPLRIESGLGNEIEPSYGEDDGPAPRTGLFLADPADDSAADGNGNVYVYSPLIAAGTDIFTGTISELDADASLVVAGKAGDLQQMIGGAQESGRFVDAIAGQLSGDAKLRLANASGELLVFTNNEGRQGTGTGIPYSLAGRVDMPYSEVYGVARKDDVVFVANGLGGVQVVDISNIAAPYHVSYIKPNGFARDVAKAW